MPTYPSLDANGSPFSPELSPYWPHGLIVRQPEAGRFILPADATICQDDRFYLNTYWSQTGNPGIKVAGTCGSGYTRAISADPTLYAAMEAYRLSHQPKPAPSMSTPLDPAKLTIGQMVTVLSHDLNDDRSYQGEVLEVTALSLPFVSFKRHTGYLTDQALSLHTGHWKLAALSPEYVAAQLGKTAPASTVKAVNELTPEQELAAARAKVAALEEQAKARDAIKVGDWVMRRSGPGGLPVGVYKVASVDVVNLRVEGHPSVWSPRYFAKASPSELAAYLTPKAGDWVEYTSDSTSLFTKGHLYQIDTVGFSRYSVVKCDAGCGASCVTSDFQPHKASPRQVEAHKARLAAAEAACQIKVIGEGGKEYVADFTAHKGCVTFGCARITNWQIKAAYAYLSSAQNQGDGNRKGESIHIGVGRFTLDIFNRLMPQLKD